MGMLNSLVESLKKTFVSDPLPDEMKNPSADVDLKHNLGTLSDDPYGGALVFNSGDTTDVFGLGTVTQFDYQNGIIKKYRELATDPEVSNGIDIIINEIAYTIEDDIFTLNIDEENDKIKEAISKEFENVQNILNVKEKLYNIARQMYIDGQINIALIYQTNDLKGGIKVAKIIEPLNLYFDKSDRLWKYNKSNELYDSLYNYEDDNYDLTYTEAELVHQDYNLYTKIKVNESGGMARTEYIVNLGYLENVFKTANMLNTLENMLVPLRYNRSVSRRLFNVDMGDLPPKASKESMNKIRAEFKYKKTYDPNTGTIKNIKNTQPLVEDYWFANRSGGKGTTLEVMDEKGALMDLEDIRHAAKKLYQSLKIPTSRNPYAEDEPRFSFQDTEITQEELNFYIFISRLRIPITKLFKEILRRQLVSKGVFTDSEWKNYEKKISVQFTQDSIFLENMKSQMFLQKIENLAGIKESIGEVISLETAANYTLGWSNEELREELEKIEEERINPLYKNFYSRNEEEDGGSPW